MKISIVLPVYNVEKYIENNIKSLVNQTYKNIEIIYVNDGSPDNSINIIKKYQKKYNNIYLYTKENSGVSATRNYGLDKITGEYVLFIDSDDTVKENMCELLVDTITKNKKPDIVVYDYDIVYSHNIKRINIMDGASRTLTPNEYMITTPCPWNKIYKKEFLIKNKYRFPEGIIYEDFASIPALAKYNPKVYYLNEPLCNYIQSDESITRGKEYKKKYEDIFKATDILYNSLKDTNYTKELEYLVTYHLLYLASLNFYKYKKYKNINKISKVMKKYFPNWSKNEIVINKFSKKKIFYMKLFYHRLYFLIIIYRIITFKKNEV